MDKIEKIRAEIERLIEESDFDESANLYSLLFFIDSLSEEPDKDFPTTDEEIKQFLATHPKVELPEKYKTPDWMFEKSEIPRDLEEAADKHIRMVADAAGHPGWDWTTQDIADAFIAGAKWQKEQDDRDVVFWKGMQYAIKGMKEEAAEGVVQDHGQFISFGDGKYIDLDPTLENKPIVDLADGDKVCVLIIKDDGKSD